MGTMKTPGVYVVEKNAFPNSVVEVATAVPAFIGYTEKADNGGKTLLNKPWRITSMSEFRNYYGEAPVSQFTIDAVAAPAEGEEAAPAVEAAFKVADTEYTVGKTGNQHSLYYNMMMFFQNGGGPCYIVSVGSYADEVNKGKLQAGIKPLIKEQEPTMVVIPEAVLLGKDDCIALQQSMLSHCGSKMRNRVAILDVFDGYKDRQDPSGDCIADFRNALGINFLDFASAYYPWVHTSIVQDSDLGFQNIAEADSLKKLLSAELEAAYAGIVAPDPENPHDDDETNARLLGKKAEVQHEIDKLGTDMSAAEAAMLNKTLTSICPVYGKLIGEIKQQLNLMPPSATMAGVYTMVDNARGVWKAPANVSLNSVVAPAVNISHDDQEDLNVTAQGKSINAIRAFVGEGTLVWGARTLDGNSLDWRYISVRRTMIMLEESIRLAAKAYVFEPNVANTWVSVSSMITNFLTGIWKRGGLAGASPTDAFSVSVGLGNTMTGEDILEGIMRVTVLVAISRPAEFIEITFQQQMQKS